jgi:hypothetical protein
MTDCGPTASQVPALPADDQLRLLGAVIDALVSCALFASSFVAIDAIRQARGEMLSITDAAAVLLAFWAVDVLVYAVAISTLRASIGNLLTARRVVNTSDGTALKLPRAIKRYFARRRLLRWFIEASGRSAERHEQIGQAPEVPLVPIPGTLFATVLATSIVATLQGPIGSTASVADRSVGSAVIRSTSKV